MEAGKTQDTALNRSFKWYNPMNYAVWRIVTLLRLHVIIPNLNVNNKTKIPVLG